jgi:hypothetical protein
MILPVSEAVFMVCDALGDAYRAGVPLPLDAHAVAAEQLRDAAVAVRGMEKALDRHVAECRAHGPGLRVIDGGRER